MNTKELIIQLIQQDLKHNQLIENLRKIGLDDEGAYSLGILEIITKLMDVPNGEGTNDWNQIYISFLTDAHRLPISERPTNFKPIAEKCYDLLCSGLEIEKRFLRENQTDQL